MKDNTLGVIIGRFQTDELTQGHQNLLDYVFHNHDRVLVLIGETEAIGTRRDPLDFFSRKDMITEYVEDHLSQDFYCVRIKNHISDEVWSQNVDSIISDILNSEFFGGTAILYGGRDSFIPHYKGKFQTHYITDIIERVSASEVRDRVAADLAKDDCWCDASFRRGMIRSAYMNYPRVITTVDVVPYSPFLDSILMGKKEGETLWRFIGGFTSPDSISDEADASKELLEETGLSISPVNMKYLFSTNVDDWRYRRTPEVKVRTRVFTCKVYQANFEHIKAGDDIQEVGWVPLFTDLKSINPVHREIFKRVQQLI